MSTSQAGLCPYTQRVVSFPADPTLGRLCSLITVVPPQPNSPYATIRPHNRPGNPRTTNQTKCRRKTIVASHTPPGNPGASPPRFIVIHNISHILESSSTGSSFPAEKTRPVPLARGFATQIIGTVGISLLHSCTSLIR